MSQANQAPQVETYGFAPEGPIDVSSAPACTAKLDRDKLRAVKAYIGDLGPALQKKYGRSDHYSPAQVRETAIERGLSIDYMCWAFLLYCSQPDFSHIHSAAGEVCDYLAMREVVAGTFFGGNAAFDAIEVAATLAAGSIETATAAASGASSWLHDVDWSGLLDWS